MKRSDNAVLDQAIALSKAGHFSDAERLFKALLLRQPNHVRALDRFGILLAQVGRFEEAERSIRQAISLGSRSGKAFYNHGTILKHLQRWPEALEAFSKALAIDPADPETWNNRGTVFNDLTRYQEAINDFDKAISLQADFVGAFYNKAKSLLLSGRHAEASAVLDRALTVKPELAETWIARQSLLQSPHALRRSTRPFQPEPAEAWVACGNVLYQYQRLTSAGPALAAYDRALALKPDLAEAWLGRGNILHLLMRNDEALAAYDKAVAIEPDLTEAWLGRGRTLQALKRSAEAIVAYRQAREKGCDAELIQCTLASLGAEPVPDSAPRGLVTDLYDRYADHYDQHVIGVLKYRTPDLLLDALGSFLPSSGLDILDLGCGTGLFGARLRSRARTLTGVDISPSMLKHARHREIYDNLFCGELTEFLPTQARNFDLAVAADVFGYIGNLSGVFQGVRGALRPGGFFCFSVEAGDERDFVLKTSLRYAHSVAYIRRLAGDYGFVLQTTESRVLRQDEGVDVGGHIVIMRNA